MASCCGRNAPYPSALTMAQNASATIVQAIRHASKSGELIADESIIKARMKICATCPRKSGVRCVECGCYITLKTAIIVSQCPLKKWP